MKHHAIILTVAIFFSFLSLSTRAINAGELLPTASNCLPNSIARSLTPHMLNPACHPLHDAVKTDDVACPFASVISVSEVV